MASAALRSAILKCLQKAMKLEDVKQIMELLQAVLDCLKILESESEISGEKMAIDCLENVANAY